VGVGARHAFGKRRRFVVSRTACKTRTGAAPTSEAAPSEMGATRGPGVHCLWRQAARSPGARNRYVPRPSRHACAVTPGNTPTRLPGGVIVTVPRPGCDLGAQSLWGKCAQSNISSILVCTAPDHRSRGGAAVRTAVRPPFGARRIEGARPDLTEPAATWGVAGPRVALSPANAGRREGVLELGPPAACPVPSPRRSEPGTANSWSGRPQSASK
jgi:hypothetical protein